MISRNWSISASPTGGLYIWRLQTVPCSMIFVGWMSMRIRSSSSRVVSYILLRRPASSLALFLKRGMQGMNISRFPMCFSTTGWWGFMISTGRPFRDSTWRGGFCRFRSATLPMMVVYVFLQKYFIKGITIGSVKE